MRPRCALLALLFACAPPRPLPPSVRALTVLMEWPATVSGIPRSADTDEVAAALPDVIAKELFAQGLRVAHIEAEPHDLAVKASVQLEQELRIDPFTTRPVKGRYRGVARLAFEGGSVEIELYDTRLDLLAATVGPKLAREFAHSEKLLAFSLDRCLRNPERSAACPASTSSAK